MQMKVVKPHVNMCTRDLSLSTVSTAVQYAVVPIQMQLDQGIRRPF